MSAKTPGLVLPADAVSDVEAQTFPGFPGVFHPDVPVPLSLLGFESEDEAWARVEELGLPLEPADAEPAKVEGADDRAAALAKLTKAELAELAPADVELAGTKDEMVATLAAAGVEPPSDDEVDA